MAVFSKLFTRSAYIFRYIKYLLKAGKRNGHGIHSPFVYDMVTRAVYSKTPKEIEHRLKIYRQHQLCDQTKIQVADYGSGSMYFRSNIRRVSQLVKVTATPPRYASLLWRMVNYFKPATVIELGTATGLTTLYLASHDFQPKVYTIEGAENLHKIAVELFKKISLNNITAVCGEFSAVLPQILANAQPPLLVYIDGNHAYEPTMSYFNQIMEYRHQQLVITIADIHLSQEMEKAWQEICSHSDSTITIDIFEMGLVIINTHCTKQHYIIAF